MTRMMKLAGLTALAALAACTQNSDTSDSASTNNLAASGDVQLNAVSLVGSVDVQADDFGAAAVSFVSARRAALGITASDSVSVRGISRGAGATTHVRLDQTYGGVRVFGGDVVAHAEDNAVVSISGLLATHLDGFDVNPLLTGDAAMNAAKARFLGTSKATYTFDRESTELVILPAESGGAHLAYRVEFHTELENGRVPGLWNFFVDAKSGAILKEFNAIHTVEASGPGGNAKVSRSWNNQLDVTASNASYVEETSRLQTVTMKNSTTGAGVSISGSLTSIGDAAENDAHGFAEVTLNMLNDWMGYNSIDEKGFKIVSRVHYGSHYENAYWDGTQMTYGDGATYFYALSGAIDVVAHEIDHGFTSNHSNLTYSGQSGGMNEAFSDIAGTIAEFYYKGAAGDFDIGTDVFKQPGALRYMCNPTADGASIDNAANYTSSLDVHYSSGVYNKSFCLAAKRLSSGSPTGAATADGVKRAGKAYYEANANYWTAGATFITGCTGVLDAATKLAYPAADIAALKQSFADVGVPCTVTSGGGGSNAAPTATITSPTTGATVTGTVTVSATATDSDGTVAKVVFKLPDGTSVIDATSPYSVTWNSTAFADGAGVISATATDNAGATSVVSTVSITVKNSTTPPTSGDWSGSATPNVALKDKGQVCSSVSVTAAGDASTVKLDLSGTHTYRSVLRATLAHNGKTLTAFATRSFPSSSGTFSLSSKAISGFSGSATGPWTVCVTDTDAFGDSGFLNSLAVHN